MNYLFRLFTRTLAVVLVFALTLSVIPTSAAAQSGLLSTSACPLLTTEALNAQMISPIRAFLSSTPKVFAYRSVLPIFMGLGTLLTSGAKKAQAYQEVYDAHSHKLIAFVTEQGDTLGKIALERLQPPYYGSVSAVHQLATHLPKNIIRPVWDHLEVKEIIPTDGLHVLASKMYDPVFTAFQHHVPLDTSADFFKTIPLTPVVAWDHVALTGLAIGLVLLGAFIIYKKLSELHELPKTTIYQLNTESWKRYYTGTYQGWRRSFVRKVAIVVLAMGSLRTGSRMEESYTAANAMQSQSAPITSEESPTFIKFDANKVIHTLLNVKNTPALMKGDEIVLTLKSNQPLGPISVRLIANTLNGIHVIQADHLSVTAAGQVVIILPKDFTPDQIDIDPRANSSAIKVRHQFHYVTDKERLKNIEKLRTLKFWELPETAMLPKNKFPRRSPLTVQA